MEKYLPISYKEAVLNLIQRWPFPETILGKVCKRMGLIEKQCYHAHQTVPCYSIFISMRIWDGKYTALFWYPLGETNFW